MSPSPAPTRGERTAPRSSLSLTLATPDGAILKRFNSTQGSIELGRGHKNSDECRDPSQGRFRLEGSAVMSSKQAVLTWEDDSYAFVTDTESTNGTFISRDGEDQTRLKPGVSYRLENKDLITFGQPVQSSRAERKCEPTPLRVAIFTTLIATSTSVEPRLEERNLSAMSTSSPKDYALSRSRTLKPGRRQSSVSSSDNEQDQDDRDAELWHSTLRTPSRGFGLSEDDLLQSTEEGELEVVVETTILKTVKSGGSSDDEERHAAWVDSDDEIEVVESTQPAELIVLGDSASDQGESASDMQLDDDEEEEEEKEEEEISDDEGEPSDVDEAWKEDVDDDDDAAEVESDHEMSDIAVEDDQGSEEDVIVQQVASRSPSPHLPSAREDSPIVEDISVVTAVTIEETECSPLQAAVAFTTSVKVPLSPAPQRLPSPVSPDQLPSRPLDKSPTPKEPSPELEAPPLPSFSFDAFPPSQIKPKRSLFSGGFFQKLNIPKASSATTSTRAEQGSRCASPFDGTTASVLSFAALDDEVESQASHLPSPTSSNDLEYDDAADDVEEERNPWASAGDWGTSIFKAAEEDSAAASEQGAESRDESVRPLHEDDLPLEYSQSASDDDDEVDAEQDAFGETDELDLDMASEEVANAEWFGRELIELDDALATFEAASTDSPSAQDLEKVITIATLPAASRKRTFSSTDMSTSTDAVFTADASVDTLALAHSPSPSAYTPPSLPVAPLPKRRRIVRDLGHVTLGFGLGVVAAVAGLSALSGAIQAMDV